MRVHTLLIKEYLWRPEDFWDAVLSCGSWGLNPGHRIWQWASLPSTGPLLWYILRWWTLCFPYVAGAGAMLMCPRCTLSLSWGTQSQKRELGEGVETEKGLVWSHPVPCWENPQACQCPSLWFRNDQSYSKLLMEAKMVPSVVKLKTATHVCL